MLLSGICVGLTAVQVAFWILLDRGFRRALRASAHVARGPIREVPSVVVAARNEASVVPALIEALANQTVRPSEVILVDDGSSDGTADTAAREADAFGVTLRTLRRPDDGGSKKAALTLGIAGASASAVALTDGDCIPDAGWLEAIARGHGASNGQVLLLAGYSPYVRRPGLLNRMARYETFVTGFLTAAAIGLRRGYMGVGRSLSYRRETFAAIGGFAHSSQIRSGDDDLLIQEVVRREAADVAALLEPGTFVHTDAPTTWRAWFRQKRRHIAASRHYDRRVSVCLGVLHGSGLATWAFPFVLGWTGVALLLLRLLAQYVVLHRAAQRLGDRDLLPWFVPLEAGWTLVSTLLSPVAMISPRNWW